jgi:uncharacterized protein (DUF2141 family)
MKSIFSIYIFGIFLINSALACSSFCIQNGHKIVVGKNFDWVHEEGLVFVNASNTYKKAIIFGNFQTPSWTSKYGSLTFNQIGKEFPFGGINEKGLVVELLWLYNTEYYQNENKEVMSELQWIQYQLDNYATFDEVEQNLKRFSIRPLYSKIHFLITDKQGNSGIIEFLNGEPVVTKSNREHLFISNNSVEDARNLSANNPPINQIRQVPLFNYCKLKYQCATIKKEDDLLVKSEEMLNSIFFRKGLKTMWSIIYDVTDMKISFRTQTFSKKRNIDISTIDFTKNSFFNFTEDSTDVAFKPLNQEYLTKYGETVLTKYRIPISPTDLAKYQLNPSLGYENKDLFTNTTTFKVTFEPEKKMGTIFFTMSNSAENYKKFIPLETGQVNTFSKWTMVFYNVPFGDTYAIASYHDIDGDGRMKTGLFGIPTEPSGFSGNGKAIFGLPKFDKVKFAINKQQNSIAIKIK